MNCLWCPCEDKMYHLFSPVYYFSTCTAVSAPFCYRPFSSPLCYEAQLQLSQHCRDCMSFLHWLTPRIPHLTTREHYPHYQELSFECKSAASNSNENGPVIDRVTVSSCCVGAYLVLTLCGLALRSTRMTRPRVQRTSP